MAQPSSPVNCSTASVIARLENAISDASEGELTDVSACCELLAAAGEALGALKVMGHLSMTQLMYDFARLAAMAGDAPSDFSSKASR